MKNKYVLLSLDPIYSPLHEKIADLLSTQRFAITSCMAKKVYLKNYQLTLASKLIKQYPNQPKPKSIKKIQTLKSYHHSYVKKIENRELSSTETIYMATFYEALIEFIEHHKINLILLHNDTRWYHAVAILICREQNIQYLVTEQGLIRPHTTVIDNKGVNAFSSLAKIDLSNLEISETSNEQFKPGSGHDSWRSILMFFFFIAIFTYERKIGKNHTILRYMHNSYSVKKYITRFKNRLRKKKNISVKNNSEIQPNSVLLLLQLELDSQLLCHSEFFDNQSLIDQVFEHCHNCGMKLAIKKHPLDLKTYNLPTESYWVEGKLEQLGSQAVAVVTINSSASVEILKTTTPLYLLGASAYNHPGVANYININQLNDKLNNHQEQKTNQRKLFLNYISDSYLLKGAGYSFHPRLLKNKLEQLLAEENK